MKPTIGRTVIFISPKMVNGTFYHPATLTRVWEDGDPFDIAVCVNAIVHFDAEGSAPRTSIRMFDTRADAESWLAVAHQPGARRPAVCFWPERV